MCENIIAGKKENEKLTINCFKVNEKEYVCQIIYSKGCYQIVSERNKGLTEEEVVKKTVLKMKFLMQQRKDATVDILEKVLAVYKKED